MKACLALTACVLACLAACDSLDWPDECFDKTGKGPKREIIEVPCAPPGTGMSSPDGGAPALTTPSDASSD